MKRRLLILGLIAIGVFSISVTLIGRATAQGLNAQRGAEPTEIVATTSEITVFRSPTCSCCAQWIEHMETSGFQVRDNVTEDLTAIKEQYGVPANLASCHTTVVDGYVVEGHVPAEDVQRLLTEQPSIAGIAVPGMPIGSPGMESGNYVEPYTVFSFTESGETSTFAEHP